MCLSEIDIVRGELLDAREQLLKKQKEIAILQSLTTDFSMVRDKEDLAELMQNRLRSLFSFGQSDVAWVNEDGNTMTPFLSEEILVKHPKYSEKLRTKFPLTDGVIDRTLSSPEPLVFDLRSMLKEDGVPEYFKIQLEIGIEKVVMASLRRGGMAIGVWIILVTDESMFGPEQLCLVGQVSRLLSTALSNVLAYEDIQRGQMEKEILYSLSHDIAAARTSNELMAFIRQKVKGFLGYTNTGMAAYDKDHLTCIPLMPDPVSAARNHPEYATAISNSYPLNDGVFDRAFASDTPVIIDLSELNKGRSLPLYLKVACESGLKQLCITCLRYRAETLAFWLIFYEDQEVIDQRCLRLIEGLTSQLSVAISNIIANEAVSRSLQVISSQKQQLKNEKVYLMEEIEKSNNSWDIIAESGSMDQIFELVSRVAEADSTVLLTGETGTGKELIARAIHSNSKRRQKMMVKVNCATLPAQLIESELFGHERGSFTGAIERRIGKFELANEGTLFLDEIGELPLELQGKLPRAIQEKEVERIGGKNTIRVNIRIIAATNRDLESEMLAGRFRSDLYYRLNIFPIHLPPLRDRKEDIPNLVAHFIQRHAKNTGRPVDGISAAALRELVDYDWPGNVRELENFLERSVLLAHGNTIEKVNLPFVKTPLSKQAISDIPIKLQSLADNEKQYIMTVLKFCGERVSGKDGAAMILGVPPSTLVSRMKRLGIMKEHVNRK
jgi:formate hydrogenlyase transcriptional activator